MMFVSLIFDMMFFVSVGTAPVGNQKNEQNAQSSIAEIVDEGMEKSCQSFNEYDS